MLALGQNVLEESARVHEADHDDVPWTGYLVAEQDSDDPQLGLAFQLAVNHRIAAGTEHPKEPVVLAAQNPFFDQAVQGGGSDRVRFAGDEFHPVAGVVGFFRFDNMLERGIKKFVARRSRVHDDEPFRVAVDSVLERKLHQNGAGKHAAHGKLRHMRKPPVLVLEHQQHHFF